MPGAGFCFYDHTDLSNDSDYEVTDVDVIESCPASGSDLADSLRAVARNSDSKPTTVANRAPTAIKILIKAAVSGVAVRADFGEIKAATGYHFGAVEVRVKENEVGELQARAAVFVSKQVFGGPNQPNAPTEFGPVPFVVS